MIKKQVNQNGYSSTDKPKKCNKKRNTTGKLTKDKFGDELKCICFGTFAYHCPKCGLP